eukprot:659245-Amphidinium_carterae.1
MAVLLNHVSKDGGASIVSFENEFGKVQKYHLQNPDMKLLVKTHGASLTSLRLTPCAAEEASYPKLQGCGYRWISEPKIVPPPPPAAPKVPQNEKIKDPKWPKTPRKHAFSELSTSFLLVWFWSSGAVAVVQFLVPRITLHARKLQTLEISLRCDTKRQLLDLKRRTPLQLASLK